MLRYYFHTADETVFRDWVGQEFPDQETAHIQAIKLAGAMMVERPGIVTYAQDLRVEVTDKDNVLLFAVLVLSADAENFLIRRT